MEKINFSFSSIEVLKDLESNRFSDEEGYSSEEEEYEVKFSNDFSTEEYQRDDFDFHKIDWTEVVPPANERFEFNGKSGVQALLNIEDPLHIFQLFFTEDLLEAIVEETNSYADIFLKKYEQHLKTHPQSIIGEWYHITVEELLIFLSLIMLQGVIHKSKFKDYFSTRPVIDTPHFRNAMSEKRFFLIHKFLNYSLEVDHQSGTVFHMTVINFINQTFQNVYIPERDIKIEEELFPCNSRLHSQLFASTKSSKFGVKIYKLCEVESSYIYNFIIYTGKSTEFNKNHRLLSVPSQIVLTLVNDLYDRGHCLITDAFYTSIGLSMFLLKQKIDTYGMLRSDRKYLPKDLETKKLEKGATSVYQNKVSGLIVVKWQDEKPATFLSTVHTGELVTNDINNEEIIQPDVVFDYNSTMKGSRQTIKTYKRRKKSKRIFYHLLDLILHNSYVLYKKYGGSLNYDNFILNIVEQISALCGVNNSTAEEVTVEDNNVPDRLKARHFPEHIPPSERREHPTRRCKVCYKNQVRKETRIWCYQCQAALCLVPCFEIFHTVQNF